MTRRPNLPLAVALASLAALALALTTDRWVRTQEVSLPFAAMAVVFLAMLAVLPWTTGRPVVDPTLVPCHKCGAPRQASHTAPFCLMCGAFPRIARPD